jgi:hypothetical protein
VLNESRPGFSLRGKSRFITVHMFLLMVSE